MCNDGQFDIKWSKRSKTTYVWEGCEVLVLDENVAEADVGVEFDPGPTRAAGLVALVVLDCSTHEIPPITCERKTSS